MPSRPGAPALSRTLASDTARLIRSRIVSGELQLGEALSEVSLASELGISKTPVREALLSLSKDGLVDIRPQRGSFVFRMSPDQVDALTAMREVLELTALRLGGRRHAELAATLRGLVARMAETLTATDVAGYRDLDGAFHQAFIDHGDNEYLSIAYAPVATRMQALRNRLSRDPSLNERSFREHGLLTSHLGRGEIGAASRLLRRHIRVTGTEYLEVSRMHAEVG